jgi:hypothetical protein
LFVAYDHEQPSTGPDVVSVEACPAGQVIGLSVIGSLDRLHHRVNLVRKLGVIQGDLLPPNASQQYNVAPVGIDYGRENWLLGRHDEQRAEVAGRNGRRSSGNLVRWTVLSAPEGYSLGPERARASAATATKRRKRARLPQ